MQDKVFKAALINICITTDQMAVCNILVMSFQKFFCDCCGQKSLIMRHVFLKTAMEYAGHLCNFMQ